MYGNNKKVKYNFIQRLMRRKIPYEAIQLNTLEKKIET